MRSAQKASENWTGGILLVIAHKGGMCGFGAPHEQKMAAWKLLAWIAKSKPLAGRALESIDPNVHRTFREYALSSRCGQSPRILLLNSE